MPMRSHIGALALLAAMFAVMAAPSSAGELKPSLMAYLHASQSEVLARFGPPKATRVLAGGDRVLEYQWSRGETTGGYTVSNAEPLFSMGPGGGLPYSGSTLGTARRYLPEQHVELSCDARFTVGPDQQVREIGWEGQGCFDN
jgi:hypothetical protein